MFYALSPKCVAADGHASYRFCVHPSIGCYADICRRRAGGESAAIVLHNVVRRWKGDVVLICRRRQRVERVVVVE